VDLDLYLLTSEEPLKDAEQGNYMTGTLSWGSDVTAMGQTFWNSREVKQPYGC
jgi:hypothetical protein